MELRVYHCTHLLMPSLTVNQSAVKWDSVSHTSPNVCPSSRVTDSPVESLESSSGDKPVQTDTDTFGGLSVVTRSEYVVVSVLKMMSLYISLPMQVVKSSDGLCVNSSQSIGLVFWKI